VLADAVKERDEANSSINVCQSNRNKDVGPQDLGIRLTHLRPTRAEATRPTMVRGSMLPQ
jgi:hypothetical protein